MKPQPPPQFDRKRADALILTLLAAKDEAARLGLWRTFHGIDVATTAVGWEVADQMKKVM